MQVEMLESLSEFYSWFCLPSLYLAFFESRDEIHLKGGRIVTPQNLPLLKIGLKWFIYEFCAHDNVENKTFC